jgi:membrane associated rhomboid family serine protease
MFQITPTVRVLLIINVAAFLFSWFLEDSQGFSVNKVFGLYQWSSPDFKPYQFVTYMFLHSGFFHLFSNMLGLVVFGAILEQTLSSKKFLILYFVCGLGAGICNSGVTYWEAIKLREATNTFTQNPSPDNFIRFINTEAKQYRFPELIDFMDGYEKNPLNEQYISEAKKFVEVISLRRANVPTVGASGAIFGLIMAFALIFPNLKMMLLFPPIPIAAKYMCALYVSFELFSLYQRNPYDNVAHFAHLSGMVFALILIKLIWKIPVRR